ncbi:MAG: SDR family oxidoreductase [Pseudomonadales bacterium]|nr:SDR family oxidoreductase [Pseudomonadales bacterium]
MKRLEGKVAFITGSSSGIGAACALKFVQEGALVFGFDIHEAKEGDWAKALALQPACHFVQGSVTDDEAISAAIKQLHKRFGRLDIVVNSAGVAGIGSVHLVDPAEMDRTMAINFKGTFLVCRHALPIMMEQRSGSIMNIASVEGLEAQEFTAPYNASKGAVVLLSKNMAIDYGRWGIRVNAVCPGFIETPMSAAIEDPGMKARVDAAHQLGRMGTPAEVANVAAFLGSDEASFVSGSAMTVDGGFSAGKRFGVDELYGLIPPN